MFLGPHNPCPAHPDYHAGIETGCKRRRGFKGWLLAALPGSFALRFCPKTLPEDFGRRLGAFEPAGHLIVGDDAVKFLDFPFGSTRIMLHHIRAKGRAQHL